MRTLTERFGPGIRSLREDAGYSQESFAAHAKIARSYYARIERGKANITLEVVEKIAKGLKISYAEMFAAVDEQ